METESVQVFYSYAHEDERHRENLRKQLRSLQRRQLISQWHDRDIEAGEEWDPEIKRQLNAADIVLLLISENFIDSDYSWDCEMTRAMERHEEGTARIIPVILEPCQWKDLPFGKLQALPTHGKPVTKWGNRAEAYANIAAGIEAVARKLRE